MMARHEAGSGPVWFRPIQKFIQMESAGGIVLFGCLVLAMAWANSPWSTFYEQFWQIKISVGPLVYRLDKSILKWINDGLMVIFFFMVGLEIKRELVIGELASVRRAALPIAAALGGMLVPAAIYLAFNAGTETAPGWGIPMATDIAFSLGLLALAGRGIPLSLRILLMALAIVDDLGAVVVIAFFYTDRISVAALGIGALLFGCLLLANLLGARRFAIYLPFGIGLWLAFLLSGVHATVAGVLFAMTIPVRPAMDGASFLARCRALLDEFQSATGPRGEAIDKSAQEGLVEGLERACMAVESPLQHLVRRLHPWVTFGIMPLFALANAGVALDVGGFSRLLDAPGLGIVLGLAIGKPVGIFLVSFLTVTTGMAALPGDMRWSHVLGLGMLAGIGFTMSLFIATLAFPKGANLATAKTSILAASLVSGAAGWVLLRALSRPRAA